ASPTGPVTCSGSRRNAWSRPPKRPVIWAPPAFPSRSRTPSRRDGWGRAISSAARPSVPAWRGRGRCCGCEGTMGETINARILGLGHHVPERVVTNADLTELMDTSDEWIQQRTGIRERHFVSEDTGPADLALPAAREALKEAGIAAQDLDLILLGTL